MRARTKGVIVSSVLASFFTGMQTGALVTPKVLTTETKQQITINRVIDGDSVEASREGRKFEIRLACIDAPELAQAPYGQKAKEYVDRVLNSEASFEPLGVDRYGRVVGDVITDGASLSVLVVQEGLAAVYKPYLRICPDIAEPLQFQENLAKKHKKGFWQEANFELPWLYRRNGANNNKEVLPAPSEITKTTYTCSDFKTQKEAQELYNKYADDPYNLDQNNNKIACEFLP